MKLSMRIGAYFWIASSSKIKQHTLKSNYIHMLKIQVIAENLIELLNKSTLSESTSLEELLNITMSQYIKDDSIKKSVL